MKILIVTQYFWPENFRINDLSKVLIKRGHDVTVLTGIPNYPSGAVFEDYRQNPKAFGNYNGAKVWRVPLIPRGQGSMRLFLNYLSFVIGAFVYGPFRLRGQKFDVIFVFEPSPITVGLPALFFSRLKRAPVVFWALDLWPETLEAVGAVRSKLVLGWVGHMVKFIYERCTLVLGQSHHFVTRIAKYCSDTEKIRYFPNWAEEIFIEPDEVPAPEVSSHEGLFSVLFAGNIGEAQDMPAILDAAEFLKNNSTIRWIIVGDGRKFDWLKEEVGRRELQGSVLLLGRFPLERMPSFFMHADALLVSLKKDPVFSMTIPGKVQSYLMAGIPLVGMLDGEGAKVILEAKSGSVCAAADSRGLVTAVLKIAAMSVEERRKLGFNGRAYAQKEFSRDALIDRLEDLLREAVVLHRQKFSSRDAN